jgi:hypothetical protein
MTPQTSELVIHFTNLDPPEHEHSQRFTVTTDKQIGIPPSYASLESGFAWGLSEFNNIMT